VVFCCNRLPDDDDDDDDDDDGTLALKLVEVST